MRPVHPENVGGTARSMMAFGCTNLILVEPKADLRKAAGIALQGSVIVDNARIVSSLAEVRGRLYGLLSPKEITDHRTVGGPLSEGSKYSRKAFFLVVGGEDGMTPEESQLLERVFYIPTVEPYSVLNMASAASIGLFALSQIPEKNELPLQLLACQA